MTRNNGHLIATVEGLLDDLEEGFTQAHDTISLWLDRFPDADPALRAEAMVALSLPSGLKRQTDVLKKIEESLSND
jgi:hypothetical protein